MSCFAVSLFKLITVALITIFIIYYPPLTLSVHLIQEWQRPWPDFHHHEVGREDTD